MTTSGKSRLDGPTSETELDASAFPESLLVNCNSDVLLPQMPLSWKPLESPGSESNSLSITSFLLDQKNENLLFRPNTTAPFGQ
jgi:hypothetical protein